ncbi:MAG TPA: leucine-rich repeat domain-containing protein, partial [Verrucomicrobiae bacterium]|nr:leucine-rich repeat domain-containing protein [Verrucomicrobiae bacterium]
MRWKVPCLFLLLWAVPHPVQAQFNYLVNGGLLSIIGYTGTGGNVVIPTNIDGYTVTSIAPFAFSNSFNLTSVEIPGSVGSIGEAAFANCQGLTNATLDPGVTNLGDYTFISCYSLSNATIPDGVTSLGASVFNSTSLTNVIIPATVTNIGANAFSDTLLTSVTIPGSVITIQNGAFDPSPFLTNLTIANGVANIGIGAFASCTALRSITIPPSVANLAQYAFALDSIPSVFFQGNCPTNDGTAFYGDTGTTIYYLPTTSGWKTSFSSSPVVAWNPSIQTGDGNFGVQNNQFGFDITGTPGIPIQIEACTNLVNPSWIPLQSLTLTNGSYYFSEPQQLSRFYRISS